MNEILQFISLQMNEILKVELQFVSSQCALDVSIIVRNPEVIRVKTCNPPDFRFYLGKLNKKSSPMWHIVTFESVFTTINNTKSKYSKQYCSHIERQLSSKAIGGEPR